VRQRSRAGSPSSASPLQARAMPAAPRAPSHRTWFEYLVFSSQIGARSEHPNCSQPGVEVLQFRMSYRVRRHIRRARLGRQPQFGYFTQF